jgi:hypothetical protein
VTPARPGGESGSIPFAMLLAMVGMALGAVLASVTVGQIAAARRTALLPRVLDAANAGLDVAVAHLRAVPLTNGLASHTALPCGPFSGAVGADGVRYRVDLRRGDRHARDQHRTQHARPRHRQRARQGRHGGPVGRPGPRRGRLPGRVRTGVGRRGGHQRRRHGPGADDVPN